MKSKTIVLIILVLLVIGAIYYLEGQKVKVLDFEGGEVGRVEIVEDGFVKAPELAGIEGFINVDEDFTIGDLRGKVVLVDFWTYSCINCIRTIPYLTAWDEKYRDKGLVIVGVHTPEFEFENDHENVKEATERHGIDYAVVQDNGYATWSAYKNRFWPRKYLIDSKGFIRYDHIGEGGYVETEKKIQELLAEIGEDVSDMKTEEEEEVFRLRTTAELYAGFDFALPRGQNIGNEGGLQPLQNIFYSIPRVIEEDIIYLEGEWISNSDSLEHAGMRGKILLKFKAKEVNIVADSLTLSEIEVLIGGKEIDVGQVGKDVVFKNGRAVINVDEPRLYSVFDGEYGDYQLELKIPGGGFSFNAFTFG